MTQRVLIIEDDPTDQHLLAEALTKAFDGVVIDVAADGVEGLEALRRQPLPTLIMVDLNTPRMDGRAFLNEVKSDPVTRVIPVIVITEMDDEDVIEECYQRHVNAYIVKPSNTAGYRRIATGIADLWFGGQIDA